MIWNRRNASVIDIGPVLIVRKLSAIWTAVVTVVATPASVVAIQAGPDRNANNYPAIPDARNTANAGTARASARKAGTDATARSLVVKMDVPVTANVQWRKVHTFASA